MKKIILMMIVFAVLGNVLDPGLMKGVMIGWLLYVFLLRNKRSSKNGYKSPRRHYDNLKGKA